MPADSTIDPVGLHPRLTPFLTDHAEAADLFLKCAAANRMHHAWLLTGPKGIGKATFAYHCARYLLKGGSGKTLAVPEDDPLFARIAAGAEGNLKSIERGVNEKTGRMRQEIVVDDIRALHDFFEMTGANEGWRVAVIDTADALNRSAANALLKMLEEPPKKTVLFLISNARGRLPATIRSRCQQVLLNPLTDEDVAGVLQKRVPGLDEGEVATLSRLSGGAPGFAVRLALYKGLTLFETASRLLDGKGAATRMRHDLASDLGAVNADEKYFLFLDILKHELSVRIRKEAAEGRKSPLERYLGLWDKVDHIQRAGEGLKLGRKAQLLLLFDDMAVSDKESPEAA